MGPGTRGQQALLLVLDGRARARAPGGAGGARVPAQAEIVPGDGHPRVAARRARRISRVGDRGERDPASRIRGRHDPARGARGTGRSERPPTRCAALQAKGARRGRGGAGDAARDRVRTGRRDHPGGADGG